VASGPTVEVYYDPFDFAIDDDPYSVWKRMRAEAPLYFNEIYNFYALSRYDDVARALPDWQAYRSGRGTTADILFSDIEVPPGNPAVRGSAPARSAPAPVVTGVHPAANAGGGRAGA
jgi:cytochrome P450